MKACFLLMAAFVCAATARPLVARQVFPAGAISATPAVTPTITAPANPGPTKMRRQNNGGGNNGNRNGNKGGNANKETKANQAADTNNDKPPASSSSAAPAASSSAAKSSSAAPAASSTAATSSSAAPAAASSPPAAPAAANNAGAGAAANSGDPQTSLTLVDSVIAKGSASDGNAVPQDGQSPSKTSTNNFINFCATFPNLPITNGQQIETGSCNPIPMGIIAAKTNMPAAKFVFPANGDLTSVKADTAFTIIVAIARLQVGTFTNAKETYYSAPQIVNEKGDIIGHTHVVIEKLDSLGQTTPLDPTKFVFFKGVNTAADGGGQVRVDVTGGIPEGFYKLSTINTAANHQPVLVAVAQHGSLEDAVYFQVTKL